MRLPYLRFWKTSLLFSLLSFSAHADSSPNVFTQLLQEAEKGEASAQYVLGRLYWAKPSQSVFVARDPEKAVKWYIKAAEQGVVLAQSSLGYIYLFGEGIPKDYGESVKWFRKAAEQGDASGQIGLGLSYGNGKGVPEDLVEAYAWLNLASAKRAGNATELRDQFEKKLTPSQIKSAHERTRLLLKQIPSEAKDEAHLMRRAEMFFRLSL